MIILNCFGSVFYNPKELSPWIEESTVIIFIFFISSLGFVLTDVRTVPFLPLFHTGDSRNTRFLYPGFYFSIMESVNILSRRPTDSLPLFWLWGLKIEAVHGLLLGKTTGLLHEGICVVFTSRISTRRTAIKQVLTATRFLGCCAV